MKIAIATNSVDKINGIKIAFSRFFKIEETEIEIIHRSVDSGVSEQPFDEETYRGAINRCERILEEKADYYISCEAGIEKFWEIYFNVQVVCIFDNMSQSFSFGKSSGWQIPYRDIEKIRKSNLDSYLREKGFSSLEDVLGKGYSRTNAVAEATEHALASKKL